MKWKINQIDQLTVIAEAILQLANNCHVFVFEGEMGSGKTTLIKAMCEKLGVKDSVTSPTYSIVNEYKAVQKMYHMDLYRLHNFEEVWAIGIEEYLNSGSYCFIEWPQLIIHLLPSNTAYVQIQILQNGERIITLNY